MKAPLNRRVFVIGYEAITPLGKTFATTWQEALQGKAGFRWASKCQVDSLCSVVGEIPDWDPLELDFVDRREASNWNAEYVHLTMAACQNALQDAGLPMDDDTGPRTACLIGSALNGTDAFRIATDNFREQGSSRISPYLLPNLCANLPSGKASMLLGMTGPIFSPQGACASGNHAIGAGARMIRDGDCDFVLAGGVDTCIMPEIIHGFCNMNATLKVEEGDRAYEDPSQASRPFSMDRRGMILSEGCGVVVLASEEALSAHGLTPKAEVSGVGWTADAHHFTQPNFETIVRAIRMGIEDAEISPGDIQYVNAHGTSTGKGDRTEIECLRAAFGSSLGRIPVSSNKSQFGHLVGAAGAVEAAITSLSLREGYVPPTINYENSDEECDLDYVPNEGRDVEISTALSNSFGFGGQNASILIEKV